MDKYTPLLALWFLAADEDLELDPEREVGREGAVDDGVDDHATNTLLAALAPHIPAHSRTPEGRIWGHAVYHRRPLDEEVGK